MKGGTLFSGIGAPELAGPHIDWRWCAEIDPFACALLAERFPDLRNLGDVNRIEPDAVEPVDLVVFGSPCQSFSVAGNRGGAADPRGALAFVALGIIGRIRPRWVVFENVPGLLSSASGRDFGAILGALAKCGYGLAYRILDAQFFGVPQRRRRVFVVGCLGDWRAAAAVLFERDGLRRDPPPRREAGQDITGRLSSRTTAGGGLGTDFELTGGLVPILECGARTGPSSNDDPRAGIGIGAPGDPMFTLQRGKQHGVVPMRASGCSTANNAGIGKAGDPAFALDCSPSLAIAFDITGTLATTGARRTDVHTALRSRAPGQSEASTTTVIAFESRFARNGRGAPGLVVPPLKAQSGQTGKGDAAPLVAFSCKDCGLDVGHLAPTLRAMENIGGNANAGGQLAVATGTPPRRLTPRECERLQGLPDDWTAITYRGKPAADGPRYRAIGNSMAAPVAAWLLRRIAPNLSA